VAGSVWADEARCHRAPRRGRCPGCCAIAALLTVQKFQNSLLDLTLHIALSPTPDLAALLASYDSPSTLNAQSGLNRLCAWEQQGLQLGFSRLE